MTWIGRYLKSAISTLSLTISYVDFCSLYYLFTLYSPVCTIFRQITPTFSTYPIVPELCMKASWLTIIPMGYVRVAGFY